jgi:8-oxo-dGTP pyrophosphatase MutT (NUDIX family)
MAEPAKGQFELPEVQTAAGGIVWKQLNGAPVVALVHRPGHDDWALPKGKPKRDESPAQTAYREVVEEIGCDVRFHEFAGTTHYYLRDGRLKLVLFWHMLAVGPSRFLPHSEIDDLQWFPPGTAVERLSHPGEKELLARAALHAPELV